MVEMIEVVDDKVYIVLVEVWSKGLENEKNLRV